MTEPPPSDDPRRLPGGTFVVSRRIIDNSRDLERELAWVERVLAARLRIHGGEAATSVLEIEAPALDESGSDYAGFLRHYRLSFAERLAIALALAPALRPQLLDPLAARNPATDRRYSEFGVVQARADGELLPTGETLAFVLGGRDLVMRACVQQLLDPGHVFARHAIFAPAAGDEPTTMRAPLRLSDELLALFTLGEPRRPRFGAGFPAQRIEPALGWDDVVLHPTTRKQLDELAEWIAHGETLLRDWGMAGKLRPGLRSLFHGPPGTGKTMTAGLLGRSLGREVYQVDLSLVVSKYVGETEKNLARVFDQAEHKDWILFFDESDALFGKRGETRDAHDRYANQEVAYLLQRIERFDGVAILASNFRENLDRAFTRRFESIIYFPMPRPEDRLRLWQQGLSPRARLAADVDLAALADAYELSGAAIMNVIRQVSLRSLSQDGRPISAADLIEGARRELAKDG